MIRFSSLVKSPLSLAAVLLLMVSGCTTTQSVKDLKSRSIQIVSDPPGASVVASDSQGNQERAYTAPAALEIGQGGARVRISKDGYWPEERLIFFYDTFKEEPKEFFDYLGSYLGGGVAALLIQDTTKITTKKGWLVSDITQLMIRGWKRPPEASATATAYEAPVEVHNDFLQVQLKAIPPVLQPFLDAAEKNPSRNREEALAELQPLYDQKKITREEFVRAQMRLRDLRRLRESQPGD
jgi:hypothetical protein